MPRRLRYALLAGGMTVAAGAFLTATEEADACPRTRDVVLELKFATIGEDGQPKTETVRIVQRSQKGVYGQPCDRKARRLAEQRACIIGLAETFKAVGDAEGRGPERAACRGVGEDVALPQFEGAYRLEEATLTCDMRLQAPARPQQLTLAIETEPRNFVCEDGEPREVGTLEERCATFAELSGKLSQLAAACPRPAESVEGVEGVEVIDAAAGLDEAVNGAAAGSGDMMQFCLGAGVEAASARLAAEKARMQACVMDPPPVPEEALAALLPPEARPEQAGEAIESDVTDGEDEDMAGAAPGEAAEGEDGSPFDPDVDVPVVDLTGEAAEEEIAGDEAPGAPEIEPAAAADLAAIGEFPEPANACEARDRQNRFLDGVAGQFGCALPAVPEAPNAEERGCDDRFRALKDQYFARRIGFLEACIARLQL